MSFFHVTRICLISDISFVDGDREGKARRTEFNLKLEFRRKITEAGDEVRPVINLRGLLTGNLAKVGGPPHRGISRSPPGRDLSIRKLIITESPIISGRHSR